MAGLSQIRRYTLPIYDSVMNVRISERVRLVVGTRHVLDESLTVDVFCRFRPIYSLVAPRNSVPLTTPVHGQAVAKVEDVAGSDPRTLSGFR